MKLCVACSYRIQNYVELRLQQFMQTYKSDLVISDLLESLHNFFDSLYQLTLYLSTYRLPRDLDIYR